MYGAISGIKVEDRLKSGMNAAEADQGEHTLAQVVLGYIQSEDGLGGERRRRRWRVDGVGIRSWEEKATLTGRILGFPLC